MPKNASARLAAAGAGALALLLYKASKAARSRGISLRAYLALHAGVAKIIIDGARATQREDPAPLPARLRRLREIAFLASLERTRRLEVLEAATKHPGDAAAVYRLHPLKHVSTQRQLAAASTASMMDARAKADAAPVVADLVLVGGGHAHVHVLRMLGMAPVDGVRVTLITRDVETPYSGMLPGHVAGAYDRDECHVDLNRLARFARARLVDGEVVGIDVATRTLRLKDPRRPPIPYDVLSLNVGISPKNVVAPPGLLTPVKPIATFSEKWDALLGRLRSWESSRAPYDVIVVGGGAGGVELALAMVARLKDELSTLGKDPAAFLRVTLATRGPELLRSHAVGVRRLLAAALERNGVRVLLGHEAKGAIDGTDGAKGALDCALARGGSTTIPFDECVWCTQAAAAGWLGGSGLAVDAQGFLRIDEYQRCGRLTSNGDVDRSLRVYAAGDCASVDGHPRPKAGVFAVMAGMALYQNLVADLEGGAPTAHWPQEAFLGLLGDGRGGAVASRGNLALEAPWLWDLKDWIDRKWMWQYSGGLPPLEDDVEENASNAPAAAKRAGKAALEAFAKAPMRCGGCGAKVGASVLSRALASLPKPPSLAEKRCDVLVGIDAPDDGAVVAYGETAKVPVVHTVDFFRSFVSDPFVFGRVAANHALSDCDAMGAAPATALALCVVPYGGGRQVEDALAQMMAGARVALDAAGCQLVGGHTCEGAELGLGLAVNGAAPPGYLTKGGLQEGDALVLTKPLGTGAVFAGDMRALATARDVRGALEGMCRSNGPAAAVLREHGCVACTDVTGFGFLGHLAELCRASGGCRVSVELSNVPFLAGATRLAERGVFSSLQDANLNARRVVADHETAFRDGGAAYALLFDPQTAGGLLAAVSGDKAAAAVAALRENGDAHAMVVGRVDAVGDADSFPARVEIVV